MTPPRGPAAVAITAEEFAALMAPLGPFERTPAFAVAVSGGADSLALCLLADAWARGGGGRVTALIVDHRLRPESDEEADRVAGWLAARHVAARVLVREGPKPRAEIQAAARRARYRLMKEWCRANGVLHLVLAHHRDDQAETLLMRLGRGSDLDGLAAMAAVVESPAVRVLRPLLGTPKARLVATLEALGQPWIEDPSNRAPAFARTRVRAVLPVLAEEGAPPERLTAAAGAFGRTRNAMERAVADLLSVAVGVHPAGFCRLDPAPYRAAPDPIARRALLRILLCVGGGVYPPRSERLDRLHRALAGGGPKAGRTLAGCRVLPRSGGLLICRESAAAGEVVTPAPGVPVCWDGRFVVRVPRSASDAAGRFTVRRLGGSGWRAILSLRPELAKTPLPGVVRPGLPAFCDLDGVAAVPHLGFVRTEFGDVVGEGFGAVFRPSQPLGPAAFAFTAARR